MLTSMAAYLFYVPRYEKVVARNGDDLVFSNIPYYYYSDGCGNILNNYSLPVPDVDKKIEEYISKMYKSGDFLVSDYNGGICINRYVGNEKDVVIPEKISDYILKDHGMILRMVSMVRYIFKEMLFMKPELNLSICRAVLKKLLCIHFIFLKKIL